MKKKIYLLFLICFFVAPSAFASVFIEPMVSYGFGSGSMEGLSADYRGSLFGGKVGLSKLGVSVGGRFDMGNLTAEEARGRTIDTPHRAYGVFVGLDLPVLFRASFTYFLSSSQRVEFPTPAQELDLEGTGYAVQIGFGFAFVAKIFIEYQKHIYDNAHDDDAVWYTAGISLPIDL